MSARTILAILAFLVAMQFNSCAIFVYDNDDSRHSHDDGEDSVTIIIH